MKVASLFVFGLSLILGQVSQAETFVGFGLNYHHFDYKESVAAPGKSTENGSYLAGLIEFIAIPKTLNGFYFNLNLELSPEVELNYDGTSQGPAYTPIKSSNKHVFVASEALLHYMVNDYLVLDGGVSYRFWQRKLLGGTPFKEIYTMYYWLLGFTVPILDDANMRLAFSARLKQMMAGSIQVIFSETVIDGEDTTLTLGSKSGYHIELPFEFQLNQKSFVKISPWFEQTGIGKSESAYNSTMSGYIYEPESTTQEYGATLGLYFNF